MPTMKGHFMKGGFYVGTHVLSHAKHLRRSFISINRIRDRQTDFECPCWVMDSGAFTEITKYGEFRESTMMYGIHVRKWSGHRGLMAAVSQDYMCEPIALRRTGLDVWNHQRLTVERYDSLVRLPLGVYLMPVLQGYEPREYIRHVRMYGDRLGEGVWVGVGSVCKRNGNPKDILDVLSAVRSVRPDLRLHGFGLKTTALGDRKIVRRLYSADSMAWSRAARWEGRDANGLYEALEFEERINFLLGKF